MKIEYKIVGIFIAFGLFIWIMNALFASSFFPDLTFWEALSFDVPAQVMHAVVLIAASVIVFGIVIARLLSQRRRAEEALKESEGRYRHLFNELNDAVFLADVETGYIIDTNNRAEVMLGRAREEIIGMHQTELHPPEVTNGYRQRFAAHVEKGHMADYDGEVITKDGTIIPVNISAATVTIAGRKLILGLFSDITERKQAEELLRESEERYRTILEEMEDSYFEVDLAGNYTFVNDQHCRALGYSREEMIGMNSRTVTAEEDFEYMYNAFARAYETGRPIRHLAYRMVTKDGQVGYTEVSAVPIRNQQGEITGFRGIGNDITERKQSEEALRESEEHFRALIENSSDIIQIVDSEGVIRYVSPSVQRVLGYKPEELIGRLSIDVVHPDDLAAVAKGFEQAYKEPDALILTECRCKHKDGTWRVIEGRGVNRLDNPAVNGFVSNMHDITERKQAEEALRESRKRHLDLVNLLPQTIFELDERGNLTFANRQGTLAFGYTLEDIQKGLNALEFFIPEDRDKARKTIYRIMNGEQESGTNEYTAMRKDGSTFPVIVYSSAIVRENEPVGLRGVILDITERKQAEEREKQLQEELLLSSRLAAIGELAAGVAHEINNPLTGIMGFSQRLLRQSTDEETSRYLERIYRESKRVSRIVENLLTFARRHGREKEYADINDILGRVLELRVYELRAEKIDLEVELAPGLPRTMVDSQQTEQVFLNLILNAEQAMSGTDRVGKLSVKTQQVKRNIRVSFADNGPGILAEHIDRVFDPFFTTKEARGGTGLGLSLCHGIVTEHGGKIYARSKPGEGSSFFVELPVIPGKG